MSGEEQRGENGGELYAPGIRPLPLDLSGPGWEQCGKMSKYIQHSTLPHLASFFLFMIFVSISYSGA